MSNSSVRELLAEGSAALAKLSVESPEAEARLLLAEVCGLPLAELALSNRPVTDAEAEKFRDFLLRRADREPVQYILGKAYFYDLDLEVSPAVLIPRPETEILVDRMIGTLPRGGTLLDLGTGSGAIALAVARHRPDIRVTASDISADALEIAERNARRVGANNVEFVLSDLFSALAGRRFDAVAANLPYVPEEDRPHLAPEVALREPALALFAPDGGFAVMNRALDALPAHLAPGGRAIFELDPRQAAVVSEKLAALGFEPAIRCDLTGRERFVEGVAAL